MSRAKRFILISIGTDYAYTVNGISAAPFRGRSKAKTHIKKLIKKSPGAGLFFLRLLIGNPIFSKFHIWGI